MTDGRKTKTEILAELQQLHPRLTDLEAVASGAPAGAPAIDVLTKYQLLAAVARDVILFVRASDGRILEANQAAEETYGYSRVELLGLTIHDLRAPSTRSDIAAQMNQADLQGVTFETLHRRRDGQEFPVEVNSGGITQGSERILLSIVRDITERKRAEWQREVMHEALRQSEEHFSKSFFNAPVALSLTRVADGCFFEVNERFTELFEFSRAELIGRTSLELEMYPRPEERAELLTLLREQGFVRDYELTVRARSGMLRQTLLSIVTVKLNEEDCMLSTLIDITERKQLELEIAHLARFPAENPNPVLRLDRNGEVLYANEAGWTLLQTWAHTTGDSALTYWRDLATTALAGQAQSTLDVTCAERSYAVFITPIVQGGYVNLYGQDITGRKQMETALQELNATLEERVQARTAELQIATNRLLELDRLKDDFVSRINHELRTPLANIKLHLDLLERGKPERQAGYVQTLRREAARLQGLIEDLLKIRQLTSDVINLESRRTDLNQLIVTHLPAWHELAAQHNLEFKPELALDLPHALIDPELIVQVIAQLVHNAVSYTARGMIALATAKQQQNGRKWVTVNVADTGPGIAADEMPHIFERFYRGRAAANYKTPGTGVGLSISRDILSLIGGQITVESKVNHGSTFTLWLPIAPAD